MPVQHVLWIYQAIFYFKQYKLPFQWATCCKQGYFIIVFIANPNCTLSIDLICSPFNILEVCNWLQIIEMKKKTLSWCKKLAPLWLEVESYSHFTNIHLHTKFHTRKSLHCKDTGDVPIITCYKSEYSFMDLFSVFWIYNSKHHSFCFVSTT